MLQERRRGNRSRRLLAILLLLVTSYIAVFVWPTAWRYHQFGKTPMRTNRVTGEVEYLNLQGWQPVLPPLDVKRQATKPQKPQPPSADQSDSAIPADRPAQ